MTQENIELDAQSDPQEDQKEGASLPLLRKDLSFQKGGPFPNGAPSWLIHDGIRNRYFRIGENAYRLLVIWKPIDRDEFLEQVERDYNGELGSDDLDDVLKFLLSNNLTVQSAENSYEGFYKQHLATRKNLFSQVLHNYLFFKIPLWRPQAFLDNTWFLVRPLLTRRFAIFTVLMGILSLYLVSRQWDIFKATFVNYLSFEGAALYLVSLVVLKFLHELGHAYFAKKYNVPVPTIGVALLVLFPVLYTDTTGSVRLHNPKERLSIDFGGIVFELGIAVFATLAWVFLPDGPLRGIMFTTATLSWVMSLLVNLNPFMRFDGYYILSDLIHVENMQARGFAIARWRMREILFGAKLEPPEVMVKAKRRLLIAHAWGTWIYRFFLFLGIALLVYHFFIKIVGILLFVVEIYWFILKPVFKELTVWWQERAGYSQKRVAIVGGVVIFLIALGALPISGKVQIASVIKAPQQSKIFPSVDGQIIANNIAQGRFVSQGDVLLELESPQLLSDISISKLELSLLQARLDRASTDITELSVVSVLQEQRDSERANLLGLLQQLEQMSVKAPFDGVLENVDDELQLGQWVSHKDALATLRTKDGNKIYGLVSGDDAQRLSVGDGGAFIEDGKIFSRPKVQVAALSNISQQELEFQMLADTQGGVLPTRPAAGDRVELVGAWYRVDLDFVDKEGIVSQSSMTRGIASISGTRRSFFGEMGRRVASVLIRESGF